MAVEKFPVERGHVMMFARAIGDPNPVYYGDGAVPAPPTFLIADVQFDPDTGLRPRIGVPWHGSGRNPTTPREPAAGGGSGLHAEEHFEFFRPVRVGDVLTRTSTRGEPWEREGRRGGRLLFTETVHEYRDQDGELVAIARQVGVRTERPVDPT